MPADPAQTCAEAIRTFAASTVSGSISHLSESERIAIATELFRLADAICATPQTPADVLARKQAIRRVEWLRSWLQQSSVGFQFQTDRAPANDRLCPALHDNEGEPDIR